MLWLKPEFRVLRCVPLPLGVSAALNRNVIGPKIKKKFPNDVHDGSGRGLRGVKRLSERCSFSRPQEKEQMFVFSVGTWRFGFLLRLFG